MKGVAGFYGVLRFRSLGVMTVAVVGSVSTLRRSVAPRYQNNSVTRVKKVTNLKQAKHTRYHTAR